MHVLKRIVALAAVGVLLAPAAVAASSLDGVVVERVRWTLLLRVGERIEVTQLVPGASLLGFSDLNDLAIGDRVHVEWTRETGGVKLAEVVQVPPLAVVLNQYLISTTELAEHIRAYPQSPPVLIDVRSAAEYAEGHLADARSVPAAGGGAGLAAALPPSRDRVVVVYADGIRSTGAAEILRLVLGKGYVNARVLHGGIQAWRLEGGAVEVPPEALAPKLGRERLAVIDVRPRARAQAGTVKGAVSLPQAELKWQEFVGGEWLPTLVIVGEDDADATARTVAEQIKRWQPQNAGVRYPDVRVLEGGWKAWSARGLPSSRGEAVKGELAFRRSASEVDPAVFDKLYRADGGPKAPLLLDVRRDGAPPAWAKLIPLDDLPARLRELPRDREIVAFCDLGRQSAIAQAILAKNGFRARYLRAKLP